MRTMNWEVWENDRLWAMFRYKRDAKAFLDMMERKYPCLDLEIVPYGKG